MSTEGTEVVYNRQRLFVASCIALTATAMFFSIRTDILDALAIEFGLSREQQGLINLVGIWGFPFAILLGGPMCDALGMGRILSMACLSQIFGVILTIVSPSFGSVGYWVLLAATFILSLGSGMVEAVINPLCATMYPDEKTHKLNVLHAWWPGGLIIGGLLAFAISSIMGLEAEDVAPAQLSLGWKIKMVLILLAALIYGALLIGQKFPVTERVAAGVSNREMFREALRPGFLLLICIMFMTAITELGPDQWVGSVVRDTAEIPGVLVLVYTAGIMFVLRFFAGPLAHALSPFGLLACCAVFSAVGLFWLSHAFTVGTVFAAATIFGIGKTYFWPTMLGVTSERFPRGGALLLATMGAAGAIAAGLAGPVMGRIYNEHTIKHLPPKVAQVVVVNGEYSLKAEKKLTNPADKATAKEARRQGAAMTFRYVAVLPVVLIFIFGALFLYYRARGGYRAVRLTEETPPAGGSDG